MNDTILNVATGIVICGVVGTAIALTSWWMLIPVGLGTIGGWATGTSGEPKPF